MYKVILKKTLEEVAKALNELKVEKDNIVYIKEGEVYYRVLYYKEQTES